MKRFLTYGTLLGIAPALFAQTPSEPTTWHARTVWEALLNMGLFSIVGVLLAIFGYKLFDYFTPGNLHKEIVENRNVAAALIGAAIIIGTCILVSAAMS